jgi:hypothetical protein
MKLNYVKSGGIIALALATMHAPSMAQTVNTDSKSATGTITIYQPLTLTKNDDLVFGRVVRPSTGTGHAIIAASSGAQTSGTGGAVALDTSTTKPAKFTIDGEGGSSVNVSIPSAFNMTGPGTAIAVATSHDLATPAATLLSGSLGSAGTKTFYVGGDATIPNGQASGDYTGTFQVSVTYN